MPAIQQQTRIRIALAGNPNVGKTSLFNALTGARQHVGNYPGVTVEQRWGECKAGEIHLDIVDLPGTYSLTSFSPEEKVARDELIGGRHDVVVVVADSTALKRSLMLLAQIMQLGVTPILCLNMADEARNSGQIIDRKRMEAELGFPVIETEAHRGIGKPELIAAIQSAVKQGTKATLPSLGTSVDTAIAAISDALVVPTELRTAKAWLATRLLVGDTQIVADIGNTADNHAAMQRVHDECKRLDRESDQDIALRVTEGYFAFVDTLLSGVITSKVRDNARATSEFIDAIVVNRFFGLPIFAVIMFGIFWTTFTLGDIPVGWLESGFEALGQWTSGLWPENSNSQLRSLLVDGMIAGVGGVLVFLPNIMLLFFALALLEDTGYMARAAFLMDRVMHRFGLHGKSFVPMMTGFGCSIPGIMATRTLENERDRMTTMLVLPLMSCGARLPIWMLLVPAFFAPPWRAPVLWFIYAFGIMLAFLLALILRKSVLASEDSPFVMELPPYRLPTASAVIKKMTERAWIYLRKAGTIILGVSVLLWFMSAYPKKSSYDIDTQISNDTISLSELAEEKIQQRRNAEDIHHSIAGRIGKAIEPVISPMGFDWKIGISLIGAFAAKEVFVAQMGIVYAMGETSEDNQDLQDKLSKNYSPIVGISLMLFLLISTPCISTFAVTRRESGSWKWATFQLVGLTVIAYGISTLVYQIGRIF